MQGEPISESGRCLVRHEDAGRARRPPHCAARHNCPSTFGTREEIDDLLVATDQDSYAFIQAKRHLSLSALPTSDLASVFDQCVRQFLHPDEVELRPWSRPPPERDRFLLITSSATPQQLRTNLATVLQRIPGLAPNQALQDAARTAPETSALQTAIKHVERAWKSETGRNAPADEIKAVLSLLRIITLDVETGGVHEREAISDLRRSRR